jgi:hypothetical protein
MGSKYIRASTLLQGLKQNKYILVRDGLDNIYGINCKVGLKSYMQCMKRKSFKDWQTNVVGFRRCDFMEYITYKVAILR